MRSRPGILIPAALALLAFLVFANSLGNEFTNWDDEGYVVQNPQIRRLDLQSVGALFEPSSVVMGNWAPVTILSFAVDYAIWGLRPAGYHLTNVLLHALCTLLLYLVLARILGRGDPQKGSAPAAIAAVLFAIHPVQVESVAWVSERKNVLGMSFMLAAFLAWLRATGGRFRPAAYLAFLGLFILALLTKVQAIMLPPLILVHEWILRPAAGADRRTMVTNTARVLPAFAAAIWLGVITLGAQGTAEQSRFTGDLLGTVATAPTLILGYVQDLFLPMNRSPILKPPLYAKPWLPVPALAWVVVLAWAGGSLVLGRRCARAAFFSLWFLGALLPVLNFIPLPVVAADRYQYWAAPGFFALTGLGVLVLWRRARRSRRRAFAFLGAAMALLFIIGTFARIAVWRDSITLWTSAFRTAPGHLAVRTNLGTALLLVGRVEESLPHLAHALALHPNDHRLRVNIGVALLKLGRPENALAHARIATRLKPRALEGWLLLGTVLGVSGRGGEATLALEEALRLSPGNPNALALLRSIRENETDGENRPPLGRELPPVVPRSP